MVDTKYLNRNDQGVATEATGIALSLDGQTVYVASRTSVTAYDVSSGKLKAEIKRECGWNCYRPLCPVRGGVLTTDWLRSGNLTKRIEMIGVLKDEFENTVELWSANLAQRIKRWTNVPGVEQLIPISEERVAAVGEVDVKVLDTISGNVSTIPVLQGRVLTCNSKCHLLIKRSFEDSQFLRANTCSLQLLDGTTVVWTKEGVRKPLEKAVAFSPMEQFLVFGSTEGFLVLDAETGITLRKLRFFTFFSFHHCAFISDDTCVISDYDSTVQLLNVKSGKLLTEIKVKSHVTCLAACPFNRVLAIGLRSSTPNYKVIRVHLPWGEDHGNGKR